MSAQVSCICHVSSYCCTVFWALAGFAICFFIIPCTVQLRFSETLDDREKLECIRCVSPLSKQFPKIKIHEESDLEASKIVESEIYIVLLKPKILTELITLVDYYIYYNTKELGE